MSITYPRYKRIIKIAASGILAWIIFGVPSGLFLDLNGMMDSIILSLAITFTFIIMNVILLIAYREDLELSFKTASRFVLPNLATSLAEEVWFRGVAIYLLSFLGQGLAVAIAAAIFAIFHIGSPKGMLVISFFFGLGMGLVVIATHNIIGPIIAHALFNIVNSDLISQKTRTNG